MQTEPSPYHLIQRLPPYVFNIVNELKYKARRAGDDIVDLGMGNPDQPTPQHIVDKMVEATRNPRNHRYSVSRGIYRLRVAICDWYQRRYGVEFDPDSEAVVTIGSKEGLSHLMMAVTGPGDTVIVPEPTYPIHSYSVVIAGGDVRSVPMFPHETMLDRIREAIEDMWPRPKTLLLNYPHNPTTVSVDHDFMTEVVALAREYELLLIHDFAYADITFDGYEAPSIFSVPGAKDVAVELFSLSKSYNMAGWRVGFVVGNPKPINALIRLKSYMDYGMFQPIQIASIIALNGPQDCVAKNRELYQSRRDTLIRGLHRAGWNVEPPKSTMFVWAPIPEPFREMGSLEFSKMLLLEGKVAVSPGIGFGKHGDDFVRIALVENEQRIQQATRGIRRVFQQHGLAP
ncbi:MAG: aminotransferase class I/II-fold pyridoxal phosphate-dependent enzyme [Candidatus Dadabacteria bacterium]|nr:MAG: aminotransferase class I/II-fold pyridoxal phosphate-dependent enzyme [Candidatus Dadabacteria bacterium]